MSSVTETLMASGSFTINLDRSAPRSFVESITPFSWLCVTPGRAFGLARDEVLELATYTGVIRRRTDDLCTLSGPGLAALIGDEDSKGPGDSETVDGTTSGQAMINALFDDAWDRNGLSLGSVSDLPATPVWASFDFGPPQETRRAFLDRVCRFLDWQYRVTPDGTIDVRPRGDLFATTPSVVVLADHIGEPVSDVIRLVVAGKIGATSSSDDWADRVWIFDGTYSGSASVSTWPRNFDDSADLVMNKWLTGSDLGSGANATAQATTELETNYCDKTIVDVSIALDDPRARIEPGDLIYVYDPLQDLYDLDTQLNVMGQCIFPKTLEVTQMSWQVTEGMGVYVIVNGTDTVWDLSDYVLWGSGDTRLSVGDRRPKLAEVASGRN